MKITIFTSNQPRHLHLASLLSQIGDEVFCIQECTTVFPGQVDDFFRKSEVMQEYFQKVLRAEEAVFGCIGFLEENVRQLCIRSGDLNRLGLNVLERALAADVILVFGSSYIKPPLVDRLIEKGAINIHMGISPFYRGSSCNFWALLDRNPHLVGATIHLISRGLDSGDMLFHALPPRGPVDPFLLGMLAVKAAHLGVSARLRDGSLAGMSPVRQDRSREIRYTRNADFTDQVAAAYLSDLPDPEDLSRLLEACSGFEYLNPYFME